MQQVCLATLVEAVRPSRTSTTTGAPQINVLVCRFSAVPLGKPTLSTAANSRISRTEKWTTGLNGNVCEKTLLILFFALCFVCNLYINLPHADAPLPRGRTLVDGMVQVSERDIGLSVLRLVEHEKLVQVRPHGE